MLGENTEHSAYAAQMPASLTISRICLASGPVRASGLVQMTPLPCLAASRTASTWISLGSAMMTSSTAGSAHSASMSSYWVGMGPQGSDHRAAKETARSIDRE
jgi:hypothetical protein